jgi:5-formyltetrahydrofolate cyclo-ligase
MSEKKTLRQEARKHRALINIRDHHPQGAVPHFFDTIKPAPGAIIGGYWPYGSEFDVRPILEEAMARGYVCSLPVIEDGSKILAFYTFTETTNLKPGRYGEMIPDLEHPAVRPVLPDVLIIPLLAYDRRGHRLGQGGGYYDATLSALRDKKPVLAVGAAYAQQACLFHLPAEAHDQRLDWVITPEGAQKFD